MAFQIHLVVAIKVNYVYIYRKKYNLIVLILIMCELKMF